MDTKPLFLLIALAPLATIAITLLLMAFRMLSMMMDFVLRLTTSFIKTKIPKGHGLLARTVDTFTSHAV